MVYVHVYGFMSLAMFGLSIMMAPRSRSFWRAKNARLAYLSYMCLASILWPIFVAFCTLEWMSEVKEMD